MPDPTIRRANLADAGTVSALGASTFSETFGHLYPADDLSAFLAETYTIEKTRQDLKDPQRAIWLVEDAAVAIGYALAGPCDLPHPDVTPGCGELKRIYLVREWQGGGLGRRLFGNVMAWLQSDGPRSVWIGVWSQNFGAQRFYEREGFGKVGEYGFRVGRTLDREFILKRPGYDFEIRSPQSARRGPTWA